MTDNHDYFMIDVIGMNANYSVNHWPKHLKLLIEADLIIGSKRHFEILAQGSSIDLDGKKKMVFSSPLEASFQILAEHRKTEKIVILATGDPLNYGIGRTLIERFGQQNICIHPAISSFNLAAAGLAWPLQSVDQVTIHGRKISQIHRYLQPNRRLLILSKNGDSPLEVAQYLKKHGFGQSRMWVLENLTYDYETISKALDLDQVKAGYDNLNIIAVELSLEADQWYSESHGLPDDLFDHDHMMTKSEIRAVVMGKLQPYPNSLLWDVGAGCGSISVEWVRMGGRAIAIEETADRVNYIQSNNEKLAAGQIEIIVGKAPLIFENIKQPPMSIYIGGGLTTKDMVKACLRRLDNGGRLVACAVTLESEQILQAEYKARGGELIKLYVERCAPLGRFHAFRQLMPVTLWSYTKIK